jgi:hypothetical protein
MSGTLKSENRIYLAHFLAVAVKSPLSLRIQDEHQSFLTERTFTFQCLYVDCKGPVTMRK